jgi:DNA sulfur modification protein DndB
MDSLGFLSLKGSEKIFAIDGQHRLAGIKRALAEGLAFGQEQVPVLLVGHKKDAAGMQRTRRLFTTLNKTAVRVRKRDIIALDEDDVMAITARRLVETNPAFRDPKIAVISSQNIPVGNRVCLTTISSLYDVLRLLFMFDTGKRGDRHLRFNRPGDSRLEHYYDFAVSYFVALGETFKPVGSLFAGSHPGDVTAKQRGDHGGHLIFRPVGLDIFTRTAIELATTRKVELATAVHDLKVLPTDLSRAPYRHVIWDPARHRIVVGGKRVARELVRYMVGLRPDEDGESVLIDDYRLVVGAAIDKEDVKLPAKLF